MNNKVYDSLKLIALILLPAIGAAYFSLAAIWHLPKADEIVGTIMVVDTFLGVLVKYYSAKYEKTSGVVGDLVPMTDKDGKKVYSLEVRGDVDLETLDQRSEVRFRVAEGVAE